jgi:hypothetical protein
MTVHQVTFEPEEHRFLCDLLETVLKDTRVEEHRTRTPSYRTYVLQQEELIIGLLNKLRQPAAEQARATGSSFSAPPRTG